MTATNTPVKTNLPAEPNAFVGRERDVGDLGRLLESMRAVTLCGAGGIGKTRLALHVAHTMLGTGPDGVWFVELADVRLDGTTEPIARRVATVLAVAEEDGRPLTETLADALHTSTALIVLDNCEHVIEECAKLTGMLLARCPRLRVLATSREPLRMAGENVWRVPPLEPDEAMRLFVDRARAARPAFAGTDAVHDVTQALDGMPLALELAAARVRVLSVEQIARRLTDRFRLLSAGDRTAPARQRTLRAAIDWSHELLDDPERVLLRRLSVFAGWTLEQAEHVCADAALPADDVLDLLTALVDKSLVVVSGELAGEVRFRQLDSIREYAAERLADAGEQDTFRERHRDAVLDAAERHGRIAVAREDAPWAERVALFNLYDVELGNVRTALTWSLDHGDIGEGLRICTALRTFWIVRGRVTEWAGWTDRFLTAAPGLGSDAPGPDVLGPALVARAQLALGGRDYVQAARYADDGLASCRACGDDFMTASALIAGAECLVRAGRLTDAAERLDEADAIAAAPRQEWNRAYAAAVRGYLLIRGSRLREARGHLDAAASVMRGIGQLWGASHAMIGLGRLAELRGDHASARGHYAEVLPILAEIGARPEMARALAGLGRVALEQDDLHTARESLSQSLTLSRSSGIRLDISRALDAFADLVAREGDARGAVMLAGAASALREATGRAPGTGARRERTLEPIRRKLGEPLVAQFWGEGRALPTDTAIAHALRTPGTTPVPRPRPTHRTPKPPTRPTKPRDSSPTPDQVTPTPGSGHPTPNPKRPTREGPAPAEPERPTPGSPGPAAPEPEPPAPGSAAATAPEPERSTPEGPGLAAPEPGHPTREPEHPAPEGAAATGPGEHGLATPEPGHLASEPEGAGAGGPYSSGGERGRSASGGPGLTTPEPGDSSSGPGRAAPGGAAATGPEVGRSGLAASGSGHLASESGRAGAGGPALSGGERGRPASGGPGLATPEAGESTSGLERAGSGGAAATGPEVGRAGSVDHGLADPEPGDPTSGLGRAASGGAVPAGPEVGGPGPGGAGLSGPEAGRPGSELGGPAVGGAGPVGPEDGWPAAEGGWSADDAEAGRYATGFPAPAAAEFGLRAHAAEPVTPPTTLTPREREIAHLVARGLSNRGIADELVISPATVARHVTNILTKLGFSSRAQIAVWVVDNLPTNHPPP